MAFNGISDVVSELHWTRICLEPDPVTREDGLCLLIDKAEP